ncbi:terminase small subunit [Anaerosolibacter sp.]|uniref:terminase small subunit n=1 Tax=Anaerosolibacter sp. TaxID=1872527 RepID=UPI0039F0491E
MARQRSPDRDKAFEIYKKHSGSIDLVEIAKKLKCSPGTIRGWKNKDQWDDKLNVNGTLQINTERSERKERAAEKKKEKEIIKELEDADLTEKQRLFCLYYIRSFNATMAAIKAGYSSDSAHVEGSRLLRNAKVISEIRRLKGAMQEEVFVDAMDVLNKYIKIAFADITDYLSFGQKEFEVGKDEKGDTITREFNYVDFKESSKVDGTIISEVKQGKDGISIKLADKMRALDKLALYFDLFPDQFKRKIEEAKLDIQRKNGDGFEKYSQNNITFVDDLDE